MGFIDVGEARGVHIMGVDPGNPFCPCYVRDGVGPLPLWEQRVGTLVQICVIIKPEGRGMIVMCITPSCIVVGNPCCPDLTCPIEEVFKLIPLCDQQGVNQNVGVESILCKLLQDPLKGAALDVIIRP